MKKSWRRILCLTVAAMLVLNCLPIGISTAKAYMDWDSKCPKSPNGEHSVELKCDYTDVGDDYNHHEHYVDYCIYCGGIFAEDTADNDHNYHGLQTKQPTCRQDGYTYYHCDQCGHTAIEENIPALGHDYGDWYRISNPTCTEDGDIERVCRRCGYVDKGTNEAYGHKFDEWRVVKEPTYTENGIEQRECERCGIEEQRDIPMLVGRWHPSLKLELAAAPASVIGKADDTVTVSLTVTSLSDCMMVVDTFMSQSDIGAPAMKDYAEGLPRILSPDDFYTFDMTVVIGNEDITRGTIVRDVYVSGNGVEQAGEDIVNVDGTYIDSNRVRIEIPVTDLSHAASLHLTVVGMENTDSAYLGDTLTVYLQATNTGNCALEESGAYLSCADNLFPFGDNWFVDDRLVDIGERLIQPAESFNITYQVLVTEDDLRWGSIHRSVCQAAIADLPEGDEYEDYRRVSSNTIDIDLPLASFEENMYLELATDLSGIVAHKGDVIPIDLRCTNTGNTVLVLNGYGASVSETDYVWPDGESSEPWPPECSWFVPGDAVVNRHNILVTDSDIAAGVVRRFYHYVACSMVDYETGAYARPLDERDFIGSQTFPSNEVVITIPLASNPAVSSEAGLHLEATLSEVNNGVAHVEGIVTNNSDMTLDGWQVNVFNALEPNTIVANRCNYQTFSAGDSNPTGDIEVPVTQQDMANGYITIMLQATSVRLLDEDGNLLIGGWNDPINYIDSNTVFLRVDLSDIEENNWLALSVTKAGVQSAEYNDGEESDVSWTVINMSGYDCGFGGICVYPDASHTGPGEGYMWIPADGTKILPAYGGKIFGTNQLIINGNDAVDDTYSPVFQAFGTIPYTGVNSQASNMESLSYRLNMSFGWTPPVMTELEITKRETSTHKYLDGYTVGETVSYEVTVKNTGVVPINDLEITDPLKGSNEDTVLDIIPLLQPGEEIILPFDYVVKQEDIPFPIVNVASAHWYDSGAECMQDSNPVTVLTTEERTGGLEISKYKTSTPLDLVAYDVDDHVSFGITVVNNSNKTFTDIVISDLLSDAPSGVVGTIDELRPGDWRWFGFDYVVTDLDAAVGVKTNYASYTAVNELGKTETDISNIVNFRIRQSSTPEGLTIVKQCVSTPSNGAYYREYDCVKYVITVYNGGDTRIGETVVHDLMTDYPDLELGAAEFLNPTEIRTYIMTHEVNSEDVKRGFIENFATATYYDGIYPITVIDGPVIVDTDGKIDDRETGFVGNGEPDCCMMTVVAVGPDSTEYDAHLCTEHYAVKQQADTLAKADSAESLRAVTALWMEAINNEYDEVFAGCTDGQAKLALINERTFFYAQLNAFEKEQILLSGENAALTAVNGMLADKCAQLCYEFSKAPETRPDSITERTPDAKEANSPVCGVDILQTNGSDSRLAVVLCEAHEDVQRYLYETLHDSEKETDAGEWMRIQRLWMTQVDAKVNEAYRSADAERQQAIIASRTAFGQWMNRRQAMLTILYPNAPETVAEVMAKEMENRLLLLCK